MSDTQTVAVTDVEAAHDAVLALAEEHQSVRAQLDAALARVTHLESVLGDCREALEGRVDVVDGSYGEPGPNWAMTLVERIDEVLP